MDLTESIKEVIEEPLKAMRYQEIGIVVAERLKRRYNRDIVHCLDGAYNEIKDRTGKVNKNGVFVKDE